MDKSKIIQALEKQIENIKNTDDQILVDRYKHKLLQQEEWRKNNMDKINASRRRYYAKNHETVLNYQKIKQKQYYEEKKEEISKRRKIMYQKKKLEKLEEEERQKQLKNTDN